MILAKSLMIWSQHVDRRETFLSGILDTGYWILDTGYWILEFLALVWLLSNYSLIYYLGFQSFDP